MIIYCKNTTGIKTWQLKAIATNIYLWLLLRLLLLVYLIDESADSSSGSTPSNDASPNSQVGDGLIKSHHHSPGVGWAGNLEVKFPNLPGGPSRRKLGDCVASGAGGCPDRDCCENDDDGDDDHVDNAMFDNKMLICQHLDAAFYLSWIKCWKARSVAFSRQLASYPWQQGNIYPSLSLVRGLTVLNDNCPNGVSAKPRRVLP